MTVREFWAILARNGRTGAIIFVICVLGGAAMGYTSRPLYHATALFQITLPLTPGRDALPSLDVSALQGWLEQYDVLQGVIDAAGLHGQLTADQLHGNVGIVAAGGTTTFESSAWDPSPARAGRLADAVAQVLGNRTATVIQASLPRALARLHEALARSQALVRDEGRAARRGGSSDEFAQLRYKAATKVYVSLQSEVMALRLLHDDDAGQVRVLSPAGVPVAPATPGRALFVLFGLVAGVVFGVAGALIHEAVRGADR